MSARFAADRGTHPRSRIPLPDPAALPMGGALTPELAALEARVTTCCRCPRLVAWREKVARDRRRAFAAEEYWGRPVPGWGDPRARCLVVGLAPAAHGGNRTGRVFTGDESGLWLYRALYKAGFASQPESVSRHDGLVLVDCFVTAALRCPPPANRPTPTERRNCRPYLEAELDFLPRVKVAVALGRYAFDHLLRIYRDRGVTTPVPRPPFGHGVEVLFGGKGPRLLASYHPSQQNTYTGLLTAAMLDEIFERARVLVGGG